MVTVTLTTAWLNLAADPAVYVSLPTLDGLSVEKAQDGEVRALSNGRRRVVRRAGVGRTASLEVRAATRAEVDWLEEHVGDLVCVRDDRGRKFFGVYLVVAADEIRGNDYADVSLSLSEVTHSEAV